jgi:uncharacterized membrane protein YgdD (TMEM256/DUF423 family)
MRWVAVAAVLGVISVAAGALGAHALGPRLGPAPLEAWKTAASYALLHSVVLLALGLFEAATGRSVALPAGLLSAGVLLFAGSIFALALTGWRFLGPLTPLGGLALMAGWLSLLTLARGAP